jgi:hypothetical protein
MSVVDFLRRNDPRAPSSAVIDFLNDDFSDIDVAKALDSNTVVTELLVILNGWKRLDPMGCPELCSALAQSPVLEKITVVQDEAECIDEQPVPAIFVRQFLQAFQEARSNVKSIKLWGLNVYAEDLASFFRRAQAKSITLSELNLKLLGLNERCDLMEAIQNNETMESLHLDSLVNGVQPILTGLELMSHSCLQTLKLTSQSVPGESSQVLRNLLQNAPNSLKCFEWTDVGMLHDRETTTFANTAVGLIASRSITDITFVSCNLGNDRLSEIFISILFRKRNLTALTLKEGCQFSQSKVKAVQNVISGMLLRTDSSLRSLQIDTQSLMALNSDAESFNCFLGAVASSVTLKRLNLDWFTNAERFQVLITNIPNFLHLRELECGADLYDLQQLLLDAINNNSSLCKAIFLGKLLNHSGQKQLQEYLMRNKKRFILEDLSIV